MTKYIFFSGKGGVGKTTMACTTAIHHAMEGKKTLIVTTDPASNLADVFEQEIGYKITPIDFEPPHPNPLPQGEREIIGSALPKGERELYNPPPLTGGGEGEGVVKKGFLYAMEIDPDEATKEYKEGIIAPLRNIMPDEIIASIDEQLSGPCTTEMASFDKFISFMESDEYDVIIFDTAPTGHTIRLLELPVDWSKHIEEAAKGSGQTCLGPVQTIQDSKNKYDRATALLKDPERTTFVFVMRPEELSLYETIRASEELETIGIKSSEIIINGVLPDEACVIDFFKMKYEAQQKIIKETEKLIKKPKKQILLRDNEIKGVESLKDIAEELFKGAKPSLIVKKEPTLGENVSLEKPDIKTLWLPANGTKSLFFTGKGGVGKTTISCIATIYLAENGFKTLLVTTDPAAHIGKVLDREVGSKPTAVSKNLFAVMIDAKEAFTEYKEKVLNDARGKYSEDMLKTMEEELNSPCTEEMAAFDKFVQFIESKKYEAIVFDTAPTGHTLRLLDLPFDYAKQVEMMASSEIEKSVSEAASQNRFKEIIKVLKDNNKTVFNMVLYPESTPILESHRAVIDLKKAGIETQMIVANLLLPYEVCVNDFFRKRREMQLRYLKEIKEKFELPVLTFPMFQSEIIGIDAIKKAAKLL